MATGMAQKEPEAGEGAPNVILDFEYAGGLLYVSVENIGTMPAYKISVEFDKKMIGIDGEKEISALNMFRDMAFLPPQKKIRAFVDTFPSYVARKQPMTVQVTITFHGRDGRKFANSIVHNLSIYQDLPEAL
jgi:hypothetical protein